MRPVLRPGAHVLRRGATELQVGLDPRRAVVLPVAGTPYDVLGLLDGTATRDPCNEPVLALLEDEGLLMDERMLRPGTTRLAPGAHAAVARSLGDRAGETEAARGTHEVLCAAFGHPAGQALVPRLVSLLDETGLRSRQVRDPGTRGTLGVLVGVGEPDRAVLDPWLRANVPHLLVRVVEAQVRIGPLVVPGTTACVRCVDAHHSAADPAWPLLVTQYSSASSEDRADGAAEPVDPLLAAIGLAWAARDLVTYVDGGRPTTWSSTVTLADDLSTIETRTWLRHPDCGCGWT